MIKRVFLIILLASGTMIGQEVITRTSPVVKPSDTTCYLDRLTIEPALTVPSVRPARIFVQLLGNTGVSESKTYDNTTTPTAATLLTQLNKANMSGGNPSLIRLIFNRLNTDGVCAGSVSGTPQ